MIARNQATDRLDLRHFDAEPEVSEIFVTLSKRQLAGLLVVSRCVESAHADKPSLNLSKLISQPLIEVKAHCKGIHSDRIIVLLAWINDEAFKAGQNPSHIARDPLLVALSDSQALLEPNGPYVGRACEFDTWSADVAASKRLRLRTSLWDLTYLHIPLLRGLGGESNCLRRGCRPRHLRRTKWRTLL